MTDANDARLESATQQRRSSLLSVWPTDLRKEWRARTRYGKSRFLMMLPVYVVGWAIILVLAGLMGIGYYGLVLTWRGYLAFSSWWPSVYGGETNAE